MTDFDLVLHLRALARATGGVALPDHPVAAAQALNGGCPLYLHTPEDVRPDIPGVIWTPTPEDANATLLIYRDHAAQLAAEAEERLELGERIAIWDTTGGDPALIDALLNSTVYFNSLAALDTDAARIAALMMTPIRDGAAFRRCLAQTILIRSVWNGGVRAEIARRFGATFTSAAELRAVTHARSRLDAWMTRLQKRGLRCEIARLGFRDAALDGFWLELAPH
jgi:hypothetical protein